MSTVDRGDPSRNPAPLSMVVIEAIADREGVDPVDLDTPLYDAIDLDALDALSADVAGTSALEISFQYEGYDVTVTGDREVRISDADSR